MTEPTQSSREVLAKEYDAVHNRLFLIQILLVITLLALFQLTGASAVLANGLSARFGEDFWYLTNAAYTVIAVFGFAACMFPISYYSGHVLAAISVTAPVQAVLRGCPACLTMWRETGQDEPQFNNFALFDRGQREIHN